MTCPRSALLALVLAVACSAPSDAPSQSDTAASDVAAAEAQPVSSERAERPRGRPLPAFSGWTLDDRKLDVSELVGKRLLIYFFNPDVHAAKGITGAIQDIAPLRGEHNFEIVGIATGAERADALAFAQAEGLEFPVIDDSSAQLARRFGLREPFAILGVDAEGFVSFGLTRIADLEPQYLEANLRNALRLPEAGGPRVSRPQAPTFSGPVLDQEAPFDLAEHRGEPVVLIFFLHTCPHCHAALRSLRQTLEALPEDKRPLLVGIEVSGRTYAVRESLRELDLDFFPVLFDDDRSIQRAYGVFGGVPSIFLIDREGRIVANSEGWAPDQHEAVMKMRIARLAGVPVPMLLRTNGYSGNEVCSVCHELEHETWTFTSHASAFDTLVKHGSDADPECIGCHVVGYGQPGGFTSSIETPTLEDVGCESCHGRGGPHLSPKFIGEAGYQPVCLTCHDPKHSLGFDFASFRPRISHAENAALVALPPEEKQRILAERGRPGGSLLPTSADYVGSEACRGCHEAEFHTWSASPHARAVATLEAKGKAGDADCLRCHTTAFGQPGGFPAGASVKAHPDLARVGCESCHGPGGDHVKDDAVRLGSIVSLGDKCDSCVILQICGTCHDDDNDPGFRFEVEAKIERQRHGTIEAGTGKPKPSSAGRAPSQAALLARAFALADEAR